MKKYSFTLVELLAVIAIIGILAGILIPVVSGVQGRGKITQAKSDMKTIETALEAFAADNGGKYYINKAWGGKNPTSSTAYAKYAGGTNGRSTGIILELSVPEETSCGNNLRKIHYLDSSKGYKGGTTVEELWPDPWGNSYCIGICNTGKGRISPHTTAGKDPKKDSSEKAASDHHFIYSNVILWSYGPNGSDNKGTNAEADTCGVTDEKNADADDVASWHK